MNKYRNLAIIFGVPLGIIFATYTIFFNRYLVLPVFGLINNYNIIIKIFAIILSGGVFANLLSYVGSFIDIIKKK